MEIFLEKDNKTVNLKINEPKLLKNILNELNITLESVILIKNDEICLEDELVSNEDKIKLLSVVSGG